jgi:hypothetical protein
VSLSVGARLLDRFVIERQLGEGGMGIVFEAFDEQRRERVALKTLGRLDGKSIYRLKNEFRSLLDVAHPNLVRLHELFLGDDACFFTMARVDGVPFLEHVRPDVAPELARTASASDTLPLPGAIRENDLRAALAQLASGVAAIHLAGKVHRDLKPSNVLVSRDGKVTVLDFGLVEAVAHSEKSADLGTAGTPAYMAPEQLTADASPASDWYAVGVMLYEVLSGRLPFDGTTREVVAAKHARRHAPPLKQIASHAPPDLVELAMALIDPSPDARPPGAAIVERLGRSSPRVPSVAPPPPSTTFVGRRAELAELRAAFELARAGTPSIVYVEGLSGMGKTALVDRFVASEVGAEAVVLRGRCYEQESVPFKALDSVIDALSRYILALPRVDAARLTPRDTGELCRVFPVFARVPDFADGVRRTEDPGEIRRRAFVALKEVLARIADRRVIIMAIDDLQWGDVDSGLLLNELLEPPDPPRILLVCAYRADEADKSALLQRLPREHARTLSLAPLGDADANALAVTLTGSSTRASQIMRASQIVTESTGSPFFIAELARAKQVTPSSTLAEAILARVDALPPKAKDLLFVVAIAGGPIERRAALEAAGQSAADDDAVPVLVTSSLLRATTARGGDALETYHDKIRETVAASISEDDAVARHAAIADALANLPDPPRDRLAIHCRAAGREREAREHALFAAKSAFDAVAFDRAAELYRQVLELTEPTDEGDTSRRTIGRALGDALSGMGRRNEAADAYLEAAKDAPIADEFELRRRAAYALLANADLERGMRLARPLARDVGVWMPHSRTVLRLGAGVMLLFLMMRAQKFRARATADERDDQRIELVQSLALAMPMTDPTAAMYLGMRAAIAAYFAGDAYRFVVGVFLAVWVTSSLRPKHETVAKFLDVVGDLSKPEGFDALRPLHPFGVAMSHILAGEWKAGLEHLEASIAAHEDLRRVPPQEVPRVTNRLDVLRFFELFVLFELGRIRDFTARAHTQLARARQTRDVRARVQALCFPGVVRRLAADEVEGARREIAESLEELPGKDFSVQRASHWTAFIYVDLYERKGASAFGRVEEHWEDLLRSGHMAGEWFSAEYQLLRANAAVAAATEASASRDHMLAIAERAADDVARLKVAHAKPRAHLVGAAIARARGQETRARELLARAAADLEAVDMRMFAAAARHELGRITGDATLLDSAAAAMRAEGIVRPERFAALLAPGFG